MSARAVVVTIAACLAFVVLSVRPCDAATDAQKRQAQRYVEGIRAYREAYAVRKAARARVRASRDLGSPAPDTKEKSKPLRFYDLPIASHP